MCGIAGYVGEGTTEALQRMVAALAHRGPDDEGFFEGPGIGLGMRRLAIIDGAHSRQPMRDEVTGAVLVYNGELYNYIELRETLEQAGERFGTRGDTEVVLRSLLHWGAEAVDRFNGMFAFALWDMRRGHLLLGRDHFGQKPLYWCRMDDGGLAFASEIDALFVGGFRHRDLRHEVIPKFFNFPYIAAPDTMYRGIHALPPGHLLTWQGGEVQVRRYWQPQFVPPERRADGDVIARGRELLLRAVERHLRCDVPYGVMLSGGIDSNLITSLAQNFSPHRLRTFTIGYETSGHLPWPGDETITARASSDYYETVHQERRVDARVFVRQLPRILRSMNTPTGDGFNAYFASALAADGVTVALSGTGADELLGGYPWFREARAIVDGQGIRAGWRRWRLVGDWSRPDRASLPRLLGRLRSVFGPEELRGLLPWLHDLEGAVHADPVLDGVEDPVDAMSLAMLQRELPEMLLRDVDAMSMAHSLEVRLPFLDRDFVEFCLGIDATWRVRNGRGKHLLRAIGEDHLPSHTLEGLKQGFIFPLDRWLAEEFRHGVESILSDLRLAHTGVISTTAAKREYDRFLRSNRPYRYQRIWNILVLELWYRTHFFERDAGFALMPGASDDAR